MAPITRPAVVVLGIVVPLLALLGSILALFLYRRRRALRLGVVSNGTKVATPNLKSDWPSLDSPPIEKMIGLEISPATPVSTLLENNTTVGMKKRTFSLDLASRRRQVDSVIDISSAYQWSLPCPKEAHAPGSQSSTHSMSSTSTKNPELNAIAQSPLTAAAYQLLARSIATEHDLHIPQLASKNPFDVNFAEFALDRLSSNRTSEHDFPVKMETAKEESSSPCSIVSRHTSSPSHSAYSPYSFLPSCSSLSSSPDPKDTVISPTVSMASTRSSVSSVDGDLSFRYKALRRPDQLYPIHLFTTAFLHEQQGKGHDIGYDFTADEAFQALGGVTNPCQIKRAEHQRQKATRRAIRMVTRNLWKNRKMQEGDPDSDEVGPMAKIGEKEPRWPKAHWNGSGKSPGRSMTVDAIGLNRQIRWVGEEKRNSAARMFSLQREVNMLMTRVPPNEYLLKPDHSDPVIRERMLYYWRRRLNDASQSM